MIPFPNKKYSIIYADPPWNFKAWSKNIGKNGRCPDKHYPTMKLEDIKEIIIPADETSTLFLWVTYPMLQEGFEVIKSWGFVYRTVAFTWVKTTVNYDYHFGLGYWTRANPEICLLATRGKPKRIDKGIANLIVSPRQEHSKKPAEARNRIVRLMGDLPRIELFARPPKDRLFEDESYKGWDVWGNEV